MNVLFITSTRIGDAVLSMGLLDHLVRTTKNLRLTVVCGPLPASLFEGVPGLTRIIPLKKKKLHGHWFELWQQTIGTRWDLVIDLRNSAISRLVLAHRRCVFGSHINQTRHKVEQAAQVMGLQKVPSPRLWFTPVQQAKAEEWIPAGDPVIAVGPTANWAGKTWPVERFIDVLRWMRAPDGLMPNARIAVFAAPGEEKEAYDVFLAFPNAVRLNGIAKGNPGEVAAALSRCQFYLGNDSGLMHCAAAAGVPTFGLFGPSYPHLYRPWGAHTAYAATPQIFDELIDFKGYDPKTVGSLMGSLTVEAVKDAIEQFWQAQNMARAA